MNQELTNLRQTWEDPEKELLFKDYLEPGALEQDGPAHIFATLCWSSFALWLFFMFLSQGLQEIQYSWERERLLMEAYGIQGLIVVALFIIMGIRESYLNKELTNINALTLIPSTSILIAFLWHHFFDLSKENFQFLIKAYILLFSMVCIVFLVRKYVLFPAKRYLRVSMTSGSLFFQTQNFYDDQTFFEDARKTERPHYHEVIKIIRPNLGQAPPEFRELPEADQIAFVETRVLESSSDDHQDSTKWVIYLEPGQYTSVNPGDHLVSLHGDKDEDCYAVHAQSCRLMFSKITIASKSVLLSLEGYMDTVKERINY